MGPGNGAMGHIRGDRASRRFAAAAIALVAVTIGIACLTIWHLRHDAVSRATRTANSFGVLLAEQNAREAENLLQLVWKDGKFVRRTTLAEIRARVQ